VFFPEFLSHYPMKFSKILPMLLFVMPVGLVATDLPHLKDPVIFQRRETDRTGKVLIAGKLWIMEADGSHLRQISFGTTYDEHPSLYSDLKHVLFGEFHANGYLPDSGARLVKLNIYSGEREVVAEKFDRALHHASVSPIDDLIAYHEDYGERVAQWIDLGSDAREIPFRATNGVRTRDGIIAMHEKNLIESPREVSLIYIDTTGKTNTATLLTDDAYLHRRAAISPDGRWVSWQTNANGTDDEIYIAKIDGSNPRNLTQTLGSDGHPWFSRDGKWIVFESDRTGNWEIWRMRVDGTDQEQLTEGKGQYVSTRPRM
jgi:Tol biopolymer transport system component